MNRSELVRRLSFIRYLYVVGEQQSAGSLPYSAVCVLSFHDCVEWFLITACEYLNINASKSAGVHAYFERIEQRTATISGKMALNKLTATRDQFKHRLTIPSSISLQEIRFSTKSFLEENTNSLFGLDFHSITMIDLIANENIKNKMTKAKENIASGDYKAAIHMIAEAFEELRMAFRLNLMPHWAVECGADPVTLFYLSRFFPQVGDTERSDDWIGRPSRKSCEFVHELMIETIIKVEQTFTGRWERIDDFIRDAGGGNDSSLPHPR